MYKFILLWLVYYFNTFSCSLDLQYPCKARVLHELKTWVSAHDTLGGGAWWMEDRSWGGVPLKEILGSFWLLFFLAHSFLAAMM
jgi:hypothetical protein